MQTTTLKHTQQSSEHGGGLGGLVEVAARDVWSADEQEARHADWDGLHVRVEDVGLYSVLSRTR